MRLQPLSRPTAPRDSIPLRPSRDPARLWFPAGLATVPTAGWATAGWAGLVLTGGITLLAIAALVAAAGR